MNWNVIIIRMSTNCCNYKQYNGFELPAPCCRFQRLAGPSQLGLGAPSQELGAQKHYICLELQ